MKNKNCAFSLLKYKWKLELQFRRGNLMRKIKKLREIKVKIHKKIMKNYAK